MTSTGQSSRIGPSFPPSSAATLPLLSGRHKHRRHHLVMSSQGVLFASKFTLCLLSSVFNLHAQTPKATPTPQTSPQAVESRQGAVGKRSSGTVVQTAPVIQFENSVEQSKIKFKL